MPWAGLQGDVVAGRVASNHPLFLSIHVNSAPRLTPVRPTVSSTRLNWANKYKLELSHLNSVSIIHGEFVEVPVRIAERWRRERDIRDAWAWSFSPGDRSGTGLGPQCGTEVPEVPVGDAAQSAPAARLEAGPYAEHIDRRMAEGWRTAWCCSGEWLGYTPAEIHRLRQENIVS